MVLTLIFAVALAIVAAIFALQNPVMVVANFFGYKVEGSLALFVLIGLGLGLLIGILVMTPGRIKTALANSRPRRKIVEREPSIAQYQAGAYAKKNPAAPFPDPEDTTEDDNTP